jgi:hypothetical protein
VTTSRSATVPTESSCPDGANDATAADDTVREFGDVVREALDRHWSGGVSRVAVALKLDPDHPAVLREPRQDVAEGSLEGEDPTVERDERGPFGVAVCSSYQMGTPSISS